MHCGGANQEWNAIQKTQARDYQNQTDKSPRRRESILRLAPWPAGGVCFVPILAEVRFPRRSFTARSVGQCNLGLPDLKTTPFPVGPFLRCGRN